MIYVKVNVEVRATDGVRVHDMVRVNVRRDNSVKNTVNG
jgi:hypothetical protein